MSFGFNIKAISNGYEFNVKDMQQCKLEMNQVVPCSKAMHNKKRDIQTYKNRFDNHNNAFCELLSDLMMEQREQM